MYCEKRVMYNVTIAIVKFSGIKYTHNVVQHSQ